MKYHHWFAAENVTFADMKTCWLCAGINLQEVLYVS